MPLGDLIKSAFSGAGNGLLSGVSKVISNFVADPTQKAQMTEEIQKLVIDQQEKTAALVEQQYESQLADVKSARDMQIAALRQDSWLSKNFIHLLASALTIGFFGLLAYMIKFDVPASNKSLLDIMLGSLGTAWVSCVGFYFGSSASSRTKDETINKLSS